MSEKQEIIQAKIRLYYLLLKKPPDQWTDTEAEIGYHLCLDKDIKKVFEEELKKEKTDE